MKTRTLGPLELSAVGTGCMGFSHGYGKIPEESYSIDAIRAAYDYGCNFFDTAEGYGAQTMWFGHNEELVGKALHDVRDDVVLATKIHPMGGIFGRGANIYEVTKEHLIASMKRLQTDYVDLYYLHRVQEGVPVEEIAKAMGKLIDEGYILGWGLSQVDVDTLARAHAVTPVTAVQNLYNILERDCEKDIFPYCLDHGIGVVPFSPVGSGLLSGKITADTEFEKVDDVRNWVPQLSKENIAGNAPIVAILEEYAQKKGATPAQISMAWMLQKYPNCVPIPGSKNKERILENLGSANVEFTNEEFAAFEAAIDACRVYGHRGHVETDKTVHIER